jgi:hypothetical protein
MQNARGETQAMKFIKKTSLEVLIQKTYIPMGDNINIYVTRKDQRGDMNWTELI